MKADLVKRTLTSAIDVLDDKPEHLSAIVDEITNFELDRYLGWRWWWFGIPNPDGLYLNFFVPSSNVVEAVNVFINSRHLSSLSVFPYGIPNVEIFQVIGSLGPPEGGGGIAGNIGGIARPT